MEKRTQQELAEKRKKKALNTNKKEYKYDKIEAYSGDRALKNLVLLSLLTRSLISAPCAEVTQSTGISGIVGLGYSTSPQPLIHTIDFNGHYRTFDLTSASPTSSHHLLPLLVENNDLSVRGAILLLNLRIIIVTGKNLYEYNPSTMVVTHKAKNQCQGGARAYQCKLGTHPYFACTSSNDKLCVWDSQTYTMKKEIEGGDVKIVKDFEMSQWAGPDPQRVFIKTKDKDLIYYELETENFVKIDHSGLPNMKSISSNILVHKTHDLVVYAGNVTGAQRGRLMLRDRSLATVLDSFTASSYSIKKIGWDEVGGTLFFMAGRGILCSLGFTAANFDTGSLSCNLNAPVSYLDFQLVGSGKILFSSKDVMALYSSMGSGFSLLNIYFAKPTQFTRIPGQRLEYHVFESFYVREFDTETKSYTNGEIYGAKIIKSLINPNNPANLLSLVSENDKTVITEVRIIDKTLLNTFDLVAKGLVTATANLYEGIRVEDFCFSKTVADHIFVLFIGFRKTDNQRAFFVAYYDLSSITENTQAFIPTNDDWYSQIVHYKYQTTERLILVGACFDTYTYTLPPSQSLSLTLESRRCLMGNNQWPPRRRVTIVNHNSLYDFLMIDQNGRIAKYSPSPALKYQEYQKLGSSYNNCLESTKNGRVFCAGDSLYSHLLDEPQDSEFFIMVKDDARGVMFTGFDDNQLYLQKGEGIQIRFNLDQCYSKNQQFSIGYRNSCSDPKCKACDLLTGETCVQCKSGFFLDNEVCVESCQSLYYYNGSCWEHCPKHKFKYTDEGKNENYCVPSCDSGLGFFAFGDRCTKCGEVDRDLGGRRCRCRNGKINFEGVSCQDSCLGYFYRPYDDMCIQSLRESTSIVQVSGKNIYCKKGSEYYLPSMKSCSISCNSPNLVSTTHPEYGQACVSPSEGCMSLGMYLIEETRNCVLPSACPPELYRDSLTQKCSSSCSGAQYKDPASSICVSACPHKSDSNNLCYDEFTITALSNNLSKEENKNRKNYWIRLAIDELDRQKLTNFNFTAKLISKVSNKEGVIQTTSSLSEENYVKINQYESRLVILEDEIAGKCPLTITFDMNYQIKNPSNEIFYTRTDQILVNCDITTQKINSTKSIVTNQTERIEPLKIKRTRLKVFVQALASLMRITSLFSGVVIFGPKSNFLTFLAQTYTKLIFLTLLNTKMETSIEEEYLNIFRDLLDDLSLEGVKLVDQGAVEANLDIVCEKQSPRFCQTSTINNFILSNLFNIVQLFFLLSFILYYHIKSKTSILIKRRRGSCL